MKNYCFCVKYFDVDYPCQIHEKNFFKYTANPEEYLALVINHCSKFDNFRELFTAFFHEVNR